jgi:hypothetical protein
MQQYGNRGKCQALIIGLQEPNGGFNGVDYYTKKVLLFDACTEDWPAKTVVGFDGQTLLDVFTTKLDADLDSEEYKRAYKTAWLMLTKSCLQKIIHGKGLVKTPTLGMLLDIEENKGKDAEPGTFGELIRYGSTHFEQMREKIDYVDPIRPDEKVIIHKGLMDPGVIIQLLHKVPKNSSAWRNQVQRGFPYTRAAFLVTLATPSVATIHVVND